MVLGEPVPKGRPRITTRGGRPRAYTPPATAKYEKLVAETAERARVAYAAENGKLWPMMAERYQVEIQIGFTRNRPDADNVFKSIVDGSIGVLWKDDALVGGLFRPAFVVAKGREGVRVSVTAIEDDAFFTPDEVRADFELEILSLVREVTDARSPRSRSTAIDALVERARKGDP